MILMPSTEENLDFNAFVLQYAQARVDDSTNRLLKTQELEGRIKDLEKEAARLNSLQPNELAMEATSSYDILLGKHVEKLEGVAAILRRYLSHRNKLRNLELPTQVHASFKEGLLDIIEGLIQKDGVSFSLPAKRPPEEYRRGMSEAIYQEMNVYSSQLDIIRRNEQWLAELRKRLPAE